MPDAVRQAMLHVILDEDALRVRDRALDGVELLGEMPLALSIRQQADGGRPTVAAEPQSAHAELYRRIARRVAAKIALLARDYSSKFPTITVSKGT